MRQSFGMNKIRESIDIRECLDVKTPPWEAKAASTLGGGMLCY